MISQARQLVGPAITTLVLLALLLWLGFWQLDRLAWKESLLAAIHHAEGSTPVPLPGGPLVQPPAFTKVSVEGVLRHDRAVRYGTEVWPTPDGQKMGARLIVPLERIPGPPILIDRGWAPFETARPIATPAGPVRIEGYVRRPDPRHWLALADDPAKRRFYTLDLDAIAATVGLPQVAPFIIVAMSPSAPEIFPYPARDMPRPTNNHLGYAISWFGLAVALIVIFTIFARKVLRP